MRFSYKGLYEGIWAILSMASAVMMPSPSTIPISCQAFISNSVFDVNYQLFDKHGHKLMVWFTPHPKSTDMML